MDENLVLRFFVEVRVAECKVVERCIVDLYEKDKWSNIWQLNYNELGSITTIKNRPTEVRHFVEHSTTYTFGNLYDERYVCSAATYKFENMSVQQLSFRQYIV
jgi:hypothetical protein